MEESFRNRPLDQGPYTLKNTGKKPAITMVAKAELAQSYMAQPQTALPAFFMLPSCVGQVAAV